MRFRPLPSLIIFCALLLSCGGSGENLSDAHDPSQTDSDLHSDSSDDDADRGEDSSDADRDDADNDEDENSDPDADRVSIDAEGDDADLDIDTDPDADEEISGLQRVVIAGDSWSAGIVFPTRDALDDRGLGHVEISWEFTANAGSRAEAWVANEHPPALGGGVDPTRPRMMDALRDSLDAEPRADLLLLVIGGNDFNQDCSDGWGEWFGFRQEAALDAIGDNVAAIIDEATTGRPHLRVALLGYDYFHFEFLVAFGMSLDGLNTTSYNEGIIDLGHRQQAVCEDRWQAIYAHNYGLMQHTYGDTIHVPFSIPNPFTGYPEYDPGVAPAPGTYPDYTPFPGGFYTYPAPLDQMPDGIHPTSEAFRVLVDHTLEQLPTEWLHPDL